MSLSWRVRFLLVAGSLLAASGFGCTSGTEPSTVAGPRPLEARELLDESAAETLRREHACVDRLRREGNGDPLRSEDALHVQSERNLVRLDGAAPNTSIEIIRANGCETVRELSTESDRPHWDGADESGVPAPPGLYLARAIDPDGQPNLPLVLGVASRADPCRSPGRTLLEVRVGPDQDEKFLELAHPGAVDLCVQVDALDEGANAPAIDFEDSPLADGAILGVSGYRVGVESHGGTHRFRLRGLDGRARITIFGRDVPDPVPPEGTRFECSGRLFSFKHPFRADPPREVHRSNLTVRCDAVYVIREAYPTYNSDGDLVTVTQQGYGFVPDFASTDSQGRFAVFITGASFAARPRLPDDRQFIGLHVSCPNVRDCGTETFGEVVQQKSSHWQWGLFNVPDLAAGGLVARLVTNHPPNHSDGIFGGDLSNEVLAEPSDQRTGRPNDYPVAIHESFDPLLEDGTEALVWLMAGQPTDHLILPIGKDGRKQFAACAAGSEASGLATSGCEAEICGPCIPFRAGCQPTPSCDQARLTGNLEDRIRCHSPNLLARMLGSGYDVWLVDHVIEDGSTYDIAFSSVLLYQQILGFPEPDPDRRLAITGLSIGGVSTRIALRAWEFHEATGGNVDLPSGSRVKRWGDEVFMDPDRVALFLSYDAPHLGARLPRSFQAYMTDDDLPGFSRFTDLVQSTPTRELLQEVVTEDADTLCFGGTVLVQSCDLDALDFQNVITDAGIAEMIEDSIDVLGQLAPGPTPGSGDGLPIGIPAVALANGGLLRNLENGQSGENRALRIELDIPLGNPVHTLRADTRTLGSGLNTFCDATALRGDSGEYITLADALSRDCWERTRGISPGILRAIARSACVATLATTSLLGGHFLSSNVDLKITVPMRPENASHYPIFVPTDSALLARNGTRRGIDARWKDWMAPDVSQSHFTMTEDQCRFLMYHLDGHMKGDADGFPACQNASRGCLAGGSQPGNALDPRRRWELNPDGFCDPNDADPGVIPPEVVRNRVMLPRTIDLQTLPRLDP